MLVFPLSAAAFGGGDGEGGRRRAGLGWSILSQSVARVSKN